MWKEGGQGLRTIAPDKIPQTHGWRSIREKREAMMHARARHEEGDAVPVIENA